MKIVIQCAGGKRPNAGSLRDPDGRIVKFAAQPDIAPQDGYRYVHPDSTCKSGNQSWRELLLEYNRQDENPYALLPAYQLYKNETYRSLASRFGVRNVYILSAGWGLIAADFLTPVYDITFSAAGKSHSRRKKKDRYYDLCMIPDDGEDVVFLGGKDYLPLFCALTQQLKGLKKVYYNSTKEPPIPTDGFKAVLYKTNTRTNWHYECAKTFIE